MTSNENKLHNFVGKMLGDMGAAVTGPLVVIGDKLNLFKTLAADGPMRSETLAEKTETSERYVREWLSAMAASGYVDYTSEDQTFHMNPEQIAVFADESSPFLMVGGFYSLASTYVDEPAVSEAFKTGEGISWGKHSSCLFCGVAKFFRPSYQAHLLQDWIPSLTGADEKLAHGAKVADVGCGFGVSTILMAKHYPNSKFFGFDIHDKSIEEARRLAASEGVTNVQFEVAAAKDFPGENYDLVTCFDCLHDMGDPAGAAKYIASKLTDGGSWMIVEPAAGDTLEHNLNPLGRIYYGFSTQVCTPSSLSQEVGAALGAQAGEKLIRETIQPAGFGNVRRAAETPFNMILEARVA